MSYQQIEGLILNLSVKPTLASLKKIVQHFNQYTNLEDNLPPENLMVFCVFKLPGLWMSLLKLEEGQPLLDEPSLGISLYLKLYLNTMTKLLAQASQQQVQHIVLQGMTKAAHLALAYRKVYRTWAKEAMDIWANGVLDLKIRAFGLLSLFFKNFQDEEKTWLLRRAYLKYMENCKQVTWRNYEAINLMINCFCEWSRICPELAYFVSFGNLRLILLQIDKTNKESKSKRKELLKKLYSFQILNCLKLFTSLITRIDHPSISPLIYPLVQTLEVFSKLDLSTTFLPLRLHVLSFLQEISQRTGVFIPYLLELSTRELQCKEFFKFKPKSTEQSQSDLALIYQISPTTYKTTQFWSEAFAQIVKKIYFTASLCARFSCAPQIMGQIVKILSRQYKLIKFPGYKIQLKTLIKSLKADMTALMEERYRKQKLPLQYPLTKTSLILETVRQREADLKSDLVLLKQKLTAEFQGNESGAQQQQDRQPRVKGRTRDRDQTQRDQQEGYQRDNSGASSYNPSEHSDRQQVVQDVSYEGDPQNADEQVRQWSEHQWSSQDEMQE